MKTLAVCQCGAGFNLGEVYQMNRHITQDSSTAHEWVYVADVIITEELKDGQGTVDA